LPGPAEKMPLTERGRATCPDRIGLPALASPGGSLSARNVRPGTLTSSAIYFGSGSVEGRGKLRADAGQRISPTEMSRGEDLGRYDYSQGRSCSSTSLPHSGRGAGSHRSAAASPVSPIPGQLPLVVKPGRMGVRPGTEERHSGHVAAVDPTSLPRIHAPICKDDVHNAVDRLDEALRAAAEHRRECNTEAGKRGRRKAAHWQRVQERRKQDHEERIRMAVEAERCRREEAEQQAKMAADVRWKRAFERLKGRKDAQDIIESSRTPSPRGELSVRQTVVEKEKHDKEVAKSLSWRAKAVPLDSHIEFLRKIQRLRNRCARAAQTYEARKMRFERLPEEERALYEETFARHGPNPHSRILDVVATRECLYELGLRGVDISEQLAVLLIVVEAHNQSQKLQAGLASVEEVPASTAKAADELKANNPVEGINLYTFATNVVPAVRKELELIRQAQMEVEFNARDVIGEGLISLANCVEIARNHSRAPCEWDATTTLKIVDSALSEQERSTFQFLKHHEAKDAAKVPEFLSHLKANRLAAQERSVAKIKEMDEARTKKPEVSLEMATRFVQVFISRAQRDQCLQERQIQDEHLIERDTFKMMRADLIFLVKLYKTQTGQAGPEEESKPTTRFLNETKLVRLFKDFGLRGVNDHVQHVGQTGIDFVDILTLLEQIRIDLESDAFDSMRTAFEEFVGSKGRLLVKDIKAFLGTVSLTPETRQEEDALMRASEDVFAYGSDEEGLLCFNQLKRILQRSRETVNAWKHQQEVKAALENGFKESELEELHFTFESLDADHSGTIDADEAWHSVCLLGFKISRVVFDAVFAQVDEDDSGGLEFIEFLKLLRLIRDREGIFASNRQVKQLEDLLRVEMLHLLTYFKFNLNGEAEAFEDEALLDKVCECFGIEPNVPLAQRLGTKTFQDLCQAAAKEAEGEEHGHG